MTDKQKNQVKGFMARANGERFESRIILSLQWYRRMGLACVEKTPEPLKPIARMGNGHFEAYYTHKAQPDFQGTMKGGRSVLLEAKYTTGDRMARDRVLPIQGTTLLEHEELGALCLVIVGFPSGKVYSVPWERWMHMEDAWGKKSLTEKDLEKHQVREENGILRLLD